MEGFLEISIVGVLLSIVFQWLKNKFGLDSVQAKLGIVALSLAVGGVYWFLADTVYWTSVVGILAAASTVYAFVFSGNNA